MDIYEINFTSKNPRNNIYIYSSLTAIRSVIPLNPHMSAAGLNN